MSHIKTRGIGVIPYVDDLIFGKSHSWSRSIGATTSLLQSLGWIISWEKSSLVLAETTTFLGYVKILLPEERVSKLISLAQAVQVSPALSIRKAMSLLGILASADMRELQDFLLCVLDGAPKKCGFNGFSPSGG